MIQLGHLPIGCVRTENRAADVARQHLRYTEDNDGNQNQGDEAQSEPLRDESAHCSAEPGRREQTCPAQLITHRWPHLGTATLGISYSV